MRIIRYQDDLGGTAYAAQQENGRLLVIAGDIFGAFRVTDREARIHRLLAPIQPTAILCIGLNYRFHAEETRSALPQHPIVFMKLPNVIQHPGEPIVLPRHLRSDRVDYEGELAVIIGKTARNIHRANALDHVLGYTCANDVSARDWQKSGGGGQWCRGKTFDTFCPLGPMLVTADDIPDPNRLALKTLLNGAVMQEANTDDMIFDVPRLIEFLSGSTTLLPGTVILTGTPHGVGMARNPPIWLQHGDTVTVAIEGIGELTNPVQDELI